MGEIPHFNPPLVPVFHPAMLRVSDVVDGSQHQHHRSSQHASAYRHFYPKFDLRESDDAFHLDGDLPGINQNAITIEFSDAQTIVIKGHIEREYHRANPKTTERSIKESTEASEDQEKKVNKKALPHRYLASERTVGEFRRTFSFASRVDQDAVKANLSNGVLSITIPKNTASAKKITIE
ncbi:30 kDa heat shock protein [Penicillium angulare]|uniref:30 kDa heat shock protein n=1 Tax=Penicillium angulare TaxID=116970 RepID=UPI002540E0FB|nr:30 kDa heat shock protein [Penicillium angulare]KAJ5288901.1 30 kDa heat shock protein [Penicillium angulare]